MALKVVSVIVTIIFTTDTDNLYTLTTYIYNLQRWKIDH